MRGNFEKHVKLSSVTVLLSSGSLATDGATDGHLFAETTQTKALSSAGIERNTG